MINKRSLLLFNRESITLGHWAKNLESRNPKQRLFFGASGYESRSSGFVKYFAGLGLAKFKEIFTGLVFGFNEKNNLLFRHENDLYFEKIGCHNIPINVQDCDTFIDTICKHLSAAKMANDNPVEIHIDYSSMPRNWYCRIPYQLESRIGAQDEVYLWYSGGKYPVREFPTAGIDDFVIFDGVASLSPRVRTHFLGLGFDRIRSHAIWSVIDPQTLVAYYASPATLPEYVDRVESDNRDVLLSANHVLKMPINEVAGAVDLLLATTREFRTLGDVVLVPDGPKPFVLASSLVPSLAGQTGIVCFHVRRRMSPREEPMDVEAFGEPIALKFNGPSS